MGNSIGHHFEETKLSSRVVSIRCGQIIGKQFDIGNDRFVNAFLGIPFAKPPIKDLRFQKPVAHPPWTGVRECKVHGPRAPQKGMLVEKLLTAVPTSEDCLYLNVFAPEWPASSDQPGGKAVLIFIHGGGFAMHTSASYGDIGICRNLCSKDVIVVTIQYRLGILGFLATGDKNVESNLGLWDQALALNWVHENIAAFGGDPANITLFGQSAGAASVDLLCLSPYTTNLFSKVIPMGGSASCEWAVIDAVSVRDAARDHAARLGWNPPQKGSDFDVNKSLVDFLKGQPSTSLSLGISSKSKQKGNAFGLYFVPVVDGDFIPQPVSVLRKQIPRKLCMTGTTEFEALLFAALAKKQFTMKTIKRMIPAKISRSNYADFEKLRCAATDLYVQSGQTPDEHLRAYMRLFSDLFINNGVHEFAEDMTQAGHVVYLYNFEYCNTKRMGVIGWLFPFKAATHASELPYLFGKGIIAPFKPNEMDLKILDYFTTFFTNFAKYGDPNGKNDAKFWEPLSPLDTFKHLCIAEEICMKPDYQGRRAKFWRSLERRREEELSDGIKL